MIQATAKQKQIQKNNFEFCFCFVKMLCHLDIFLRLFTNKKELSTKLPTHIQTALIIDCWNSKKLTMTLPNDVIVVKIGRRSPSSVGVAVFANVVMGNRRDKSSAAHIKGLKLIILNLKTKFLKIFFEILLNPSTALQISINERSSNTVFLHLGFTKFLKVRIGT